MTPRQSDQTIADIILAVTALLLALVLLSIAGCAIRAVRAPDKITYTDNTPTIVHGLTTQKAATVDVQSGEQSAVAHVTAAKASVEAVNAEKPDARLASADQHLVSAGAALDANTQRLAGIVASEAQLLELAVQQSIDNAALHWQAVAMAKDKAVALDRADKAEGFIADHKNDIFGARVHRIVAGLSWSLLITLAVLAIGVGIVGAIYGLPKITSPAATIVGKCIDWARVAIYHAATVIWSLVPLVGHFADEHFNKAGADARAVAKGAA